MIAIVHPAHQRAAQRRKGDRAVEICLHLGAHRTGTTSFQCHVQRHRGALSHGGTAVWTPKQTRAGLFDGLVHRPDSVTAEIARRSERSRVAIRREVRRLTEAGYDRLMITEENLLGSARNNLRDGALYSDVLERLLRFRAALAAPVARIAISLRSYDSYWASVLAYAVMNGHTMPQSDLIDRLAMQSRRWGDVIRDVARVFPQTDIVVFPFEAMVSHPDAELSHLIGQRVSLSEADDWRNPSPRLRKLREELVNRGDLDGAIRLGQGSGAWMPFDADQRATMQRTYADDLTDLREGAVERAQLIEIPTHHGLDTTHMRQTEVTDAQWRLAIGGPDHGRQRYLV